MRYTQLYVIILQLHVATADITLHRSGNPRAITPITDISNNATIVLSYEELERRYDPIHFNLTQCFEVFRAGGFGGVGGVYRNGTQLPRGGNTVDAVGITYSACIKHCGRGYARANWRDFSEDISAWLIPWLALVPLLPFGAKKRIQNINAMVLYLGSPSLSAYSLVLTLLNRYYVFSRFVGFTYPNAQYAAHILAELQQAPLVINTDHGLLASLVVLSQNDQWFKSLQRSFKCQHKWSAAAFMSITWVVLAHTLTVSNTFIDIPRVVRQGSSGQAVGLMWIWLLPIVIGWLQLCPRCDAGYLRCALGEANQGAWVATNQEETPALVSSSTVPRYAVELKQLSLPLGDEDCTPPIFNYARVFSWSRAVEKMADAYNTASKHRNSKLPARGSGDWEDEPGTKHTIHPKNRQGTLEQVTAYCTLAGRPAKDSSGGLTGPRVAPRIWLAALLGLALQWLTVAGAMIVVYFTPTTGFGCHSAGYVLFGILGSLVLVLMITSGILAHSAEKHGSVRNGRVLFAARLCRRAGKCIATFNAVWLVALSVLHFSGIFKACFCSAGMPFKEVGAYTTSLICSSTQHDMLRAWMIGIILAGLAVCAFVVVAKYFMKSSMHRKE